MGDVGSGGKGFSAFGFRALGPRLVHLGVAGVRQARSWISLGVFWGRGVAFRFDCYFGLLLGWLSRVCGSKSFRICGCLAGQQELRQVWVSGHVTISTALAVKGEVPLVDSAPGSGAQVPQRCKSVALTLNPKL